MAKKKPYIGRAVLNGKIRHTSVSQIKLFDPKSEGCKRKWAFSYKWGKKLLKTGSQKKGSDGSEKLEHYLKTGEDVLPPVLQRLKKFLPKPGIDLECEEPLGDMEIAVFLRDAQLAGNTDPRLTLEIQKAAGLTVAGIPVDGAADVRHVRGIWIDADGNLRPEHPSTRVVNIFDLKMVSRIFPHKIMKGENAGTILPAFTLTDAEICEDTQMLGYARQAIYRRPERTHARLQLGYTNMTRKEAVLRQGLISVEQILSRWNRVEDVGREMVQVATAEKIEDIEPNLRACDAFTHIDPTDPKGERVLKGCGHKYYCPLNNSQIVSNMMGTHKEQAMSLFDEGTPTVVSTPVPPAPSLDGAAHAAAVAAEKERIKAEDAARHVAPPPPPPVASGYGFCAKCGTPLDGNNSSRLQSGELKHMSCPSAVVIPAPPTAVNPPDQPRAPTMLEAAAPVPPHEIAQIDDPEIKMVVEEHARQHAEKAAKEAAEAEAQKLAAGAAVWCTVSATKVIITTEMALARKFVCQCGKSYSIKTLNPLKEGDLLISVIPKHKLPKKDGETVAPPPQVEKKITIRVEADNDEEEAEDEGGDDFTVDFVAPPPSPTQANVLVESGRTSYPGAIANPPRADVPPPPAPAPTVESVIAAIDNVVDMAKTNGHTNGHAVEMPPAPPPVVASTGKVRAFQAEIHHVDAAGTKTAKNRIVLASSVKEAIAKLEATFGAALLEVRSVKLIVGVVIQ